MSDQPVALVTGGARGIGYACAEAIAADGARIVLADIDEAGVQEAAARLGQQAVGYGCDTAEPDQILKLFERMEAEVGVASILVNNAGIAKPADFFDTSVEEFKAVIDVNLVGVFCASQRAARAMIDNKIAGSIINMSSINAQVAIPTIASYCASKGGVMQLTKSSSLALAPHGIRVNAVGPGSIDTAMLASVNANPEAMKMVMSRTPLGRLGAPSEIGDVVAFLASDKASYITGETIYVDGGRLGMNYVC
ncbi:MAG: SDR family oxidoreductase [Gammaproteobacteria bacterium]|nr:SDR family oxidoreductase [Gammaproteobacteria bacterium]